LLGLLPPAVQGGAIDAEDVRDQRRAFALPQQVNGTSAPAFQFKWSSERSAHTSYTQVHARRPISGAAVNNGEELLQPLLRRGNLE
jgi:hypothetical protein